MSYDICGALSICLIHAIGEFYRESHGPYRADDGVSSFSNDLEIAGVRISEESLRALGDFISQVSGDYINRHQTLHQISNGEGGSYLFRLLVDMYTCSHSTREAKLHRDRVYALLGLAADVDELKFKPNYSSQTKTAQILTEVAKAIVKKPTQSFPVELLSFSQFPKTILDDGSDEHLPSWVPDWKSGLQNPFYYSIDDEEEAHVRMAVRKADRGASCPDKSHFKACGLHRSVDMVPTAKAETLGLQGYLVDTIEEVEGKAFREPFSMGPKRDRAVEFFEKLDRFWEISKERNEPIYTPARRAEALWRVPIGDMRRNWEYAGKQRAKLDCALDYQKWRRTLELFQPLGVTLDDTKVPGWIDFLDEDKQKKVSEWAGHVLETDGGKFYERDLLCTDGMSLYLTKQGYMGMGPSEMEAGDVVVVFPGARIPFVLRPTAEDNTFTYVGDAYCDGIMDGEITLKEEKRDFFLV